MLPAPTDTARLRTTTRAAPESRSRISSNGPGSKARHAEDADGKTLVPQLVDNVRSGTEQRSQAQQDHVGVLQPVGRGEAPARAPHDLVEAVAHVLDHAERAELPLRLEELDLRERLRADHGTDGERVLGIQTVQRSEGRHQRVHLLLVGYVDGLHGVGEDEPVHVDHHRYV